jgi:aspartyl-tRNA(Asn)/glutamyl-tRNA(Gln) amidotransferase subunit C
MSDSITPEVFEHLVGLAALELDEQESEYLRGQLNNQLKAIHELEQIPLDETVKASSHGIPYSPAITPPTRQDEQVNCPNPEEIIAQAPDTDEGYIVVPDIPHQELD